MGVVLTMTMVIITALAITRERERGTMENLLATPVRPFEVMVGKILPYIVVGYIQVTLILLAARFIFGVPMVGSLALLYAWRCSSSPPTSRWASRSRRSREEPAPGRCRWRSSFFLPSILLSGFMFPFRGMPEWAQWIGTCLPNTHFLRIVRGILLKGQRPRRNRARDLAAAALPRRRDDHRRETLPADAGLAHVSLSSHKEASLHSYAQPH